MTSLDEHTRQTLLVMARRLYPHEFLDQSDYAAVIESIDDEADSERLDLLSHGVKSLDSVLDVPFLALPEARQVEALKQIEGTPFFEHVRTMTRRTLYSNPAVWRHFDYEGPSAHLGGYIERGLDDAGWIPEE